MPGFPGTPGLPVSFQSSKIQPNTSLLSQPKPGSMWDVTSCLLPVYQGLPGQDGPPGPRGTPGCNGTKVCDVKPLKNGKSNLKNIQLFSDNIIEDMIQE